MSIRVETSLSLAVALLLCTCADSPGGGGSGSAGENTYAIDRQAALSILIDEVLTPSDLGAEHVVVYGPLDALRPGDTVRPVLAPDGASAQASTVDAPAWFFWVDLMPFAYFGHPTWFVRVDAESGAVSKEEQNWYAVINGEELLPVEDPTDPRRVFGDPALPDAIDVPPAEGDAAPTGAPAALSGAPGSAARSLVEGQENVAVVVNTWPGSKATQADIERMAKRLEDRKYRVTSVTPEATKSLSRAAIEAAIDELSGEREVPYGQFVFYYSGHGGQGGYLVMGAEENSVVNIGSDDLAAMLAPIDALETIVILDSCYSGEFARGLYSLETYLFKLGVTDRSIAVYTAAAEHQESKAWSGALKIQAGGYFTKGLLEKLDGLPAVGPIPFVFQADQIRVDPFGLPWPYGKIGYSRQDPLTRFTCPCSPRGITAKIALGETLTNGFDTCTGAKGDRGGRLDLDWSSDGTMSLNYNIPNPDLTGEISPDGSFTVTYGAFEDHEIYSGHLGCDCIGHGSVVDTWANLSCQTSYDLEITNPYYTWF